MEEAFTKSASSLVPLLVIIGIIFGGLIVLALVLRVRIRRDTAPPETKRRGSAMEVLPQDVLRVLGRPFSVESVHRLAAGDWRGIWCGLVDDGGAARSAIGEGLAWAMQFPGREAHEGDAFPARIEREEGPYDRQAEPQQLEQGLRLALYRGPAGRWLALEERGVETTLWRGKEIPAEGLDVMEELEAD